MSVSAPAIGVHEVMRVAATHVPERVFSLPMFSELTDPEVDHVCCALADCAGETR